MPEYLAPGVFIEEVSFRSKSIEGVGTTTTGFIGPTRYGPIDLEPDVITSLGEFERVYGDREQLAFGNPDDDTKQKMQNYMWHAVRAFFEEGGKRLYISRVFRPVTDKNGDAVTDGYAKAFLPALADGEDAPADADSWLKLSARFPGELGRMRVWLTLRIGQSVLGKDTVGNPTVGGLLDRDVVYISNVAPLTSPPLTSPPLTSPPTSPPTLPPIISPPATEGGFYIAQKNRDTTTGEISWEFEPMDATSPDEDLLLTNLDVDDGDSIRVVTLTVTTKAVEDPEAQTRVYDNLALDLNHKRAGTPDSIFTKFAKEPANTSDARNLPVVIEGNNLDSGLDILQLLFTENGDLEDNLLNDESTEDDRSIALLLDGGNDGMRPSASEYEGTAKDTDPFKTGLKAFEDIEDISIVAAPGSTYGYANGYSTQAPTIVNLLISHAERMKYRIAVLDSGDNQNIAEVRAMRARLDSKYAAFYYPWVKILDPVTQQEIYLPPSGFVSGIYARNDVERAVYKAPANEVVRLAIGFEKTLNKAQQEVLNPEGINCFRFFEGRGFRLWGARTISSDPEWKYVPLRRYFAYIERSIDRGTQWAVFEPNGEALWANVRQTVQDFLYNEWVSGALLGEKPEKAYFVRCDRSTMTQNDLDNGRLVCLVGMAVVKPAEFVIFRIGQWTSDRKV